MLDKLKKFFTPKISNFVPLNDPVAQKTQWTVMGSGASANFCTHKLKIVSFGRYEFKESWGLWLFLLAFSLGGCIGLFIGIRGFREEGFYIAGILGTSIGLLFQIPLLYFAFKPKRIPVFDKAEGAFFLDNGKSQSYRYLSELPEYTKLGDIYALMVLSRHVSGSESDYTSYELILVRRDGSRCLLVAHGSKNRMTADVQKLAEFLGGIPVWEKDCTRDEDEEPDPTIPRASRTTGITWAIIMVCAVLIMIYFLSCRPYIFGEL